MIAVDEEVACNPELAYKTLSPRVEPYILPDPYSPKPPGHVRFVCMSDTHHVVDCLSPKDVPDGDVLLHAGDFSISGRPSNINSFTELLRKLPHKYKIVTAGNHEWCLDSRFRGGRPLSQKEEEAIERLKKECTLLLHGHVLVMGLRVFASPYQPLYRDAPFQLPRGIPLRSKWRQIPSDTDVLVTHTPPLGHGDLTKRRKRAGCVDLLLEIEGRIKPKLHVFGHIHEGYGATTNGETVFINASYCNDRYNPTNLPVVFDVPCSPSEARRRCQKNSLPPETPTESPIPSSSQTKSRGGSEELCGSRESGHFLSRHEPNLRSEEGGGFCKWTEVEAPTRSLAEGPNISADAQMQKLVNTGCLPLKFMRKVQDQFRSLDVGGTVPRNSSHTRADRPKNESNSLERTRREPK
eukprot:Rmarinus@m.20050